MKQGWEIKKLGEVCKIQTGKLDANVKVDDGVYPFFTCDAKPYRINTYAFDDEAILISGNGSLVGHINYYNGKFNAYQRTYVLTQFTSFHIPFLISYLKGFLRPYIIENKKGGCIPYITLPILQNFAIPCPPREEQERIVGELDCLSGVIEKKREQLKQLDALAQSIFYQMFGDPITNEKGWEILPFNKVAEVIGGSTPKTNIEEYWNGDNYWVTPAELHGERYIYSTERCITDDAVSKTHLTLLPIGSVLLSSRAPIGKVSITRVPMYCNQGFKNIVCSDRLHSEYVYQFLLDKTEYLNSLGTGATFKEISKRVVEQITIPVPPMGLQYQFADKIEAIEKQKELIKKSISETETLFNARMDYYFN